MSDLINRKEAIELLTSRVLSSIGIFGDLGGAVSGARELIRAMPSAEPEEEVFEWCHDCKEYDQNKHCCHRWTKVIRQTIEEMKAESERKWIPVTEALPKMKEVVLITNDKGNVAYGQYQGTFRNNNEWFWRHKTLETIIAWMPLPEPYRGEE